MYELHTTNLIISNDSVNLPCAVIRLWLCRTVGLTRTCYMTLLCVRWANGLYKSNYKTLIRFSIKVTVYKIKGDWFFLEIFIYLPPFFDNSKFSQDMIFLIFANGWKCRENRENQIPQYFQWYHSVTLLGISCGRYGMPSKNFTLFHTKHVIFLNPISDLNCYCH